MQFSFTDCDDCTPADSRMLSSLEHKWGVVLPAEYRQFLLECGGGHPAADWSEFGDSGDCVAHVYGVHRGAEWKRLEYAVQEFGHDLSRFLPVAVGNGGSYFILKINDPHCGAVYYWDHELEDPEPPTFEFIEKVSDSFPQWLESLQNVE